MLGKMENNSNKSQQKIKPQINISIYIIRGMSPGKSKILKRVMIKANVGILDTNELH